MKIKVRYATKTTPGMSHIIHRTSLVLGLDWVDPWFDSLLPDDATNEYIYQEVPEIQNNLIQEVARKFWIEGNHDVCVFTPQGDIHAIKHTITDCFPRSFVEVIVPTKTMLLVSICKVNYHPDQGVTATIIATTSIKNEEPDPAQEGTPNLNL